MVGLGLGGKAATLVRDRLRVRALRLFFFNLVVLLTALAGGRGY